MVDRSTGQRSWPLSPYDLNVSYGKPNAAGLGPDWFGPLAPITPLAPPEVAGRQWDYLSGYNLSTSPRGNAAISFATLRSLADTYDLLRLVIETRKDQVGRLSWTIASRDKRASQDPRIASLKQFFRKPDGRHGFADWLRLLLEDLFVIDAPTLYLSRDRAGRLLGLLPIDGATIKPVIDDWGRTPLPYVESGETVYPTAYQQILKGYPAVDYSVRDLLYRPRNIRVDRAYGLSPVEQVVTTVNIALRRQAYLLDYFTQGNIPDSLIGVPETWTPDQIASYQKYWDAYFDGDLGRRRRAKFVPGGVAKTFVQTREPDLKGPFDEWLARIICFAFSISPQALTQQMNRATAETQKELAEEEGLTPVLNWVKALIDDVIADEFDSPDLEFSWSNEASIDPQTQETILSSYATKGILTINEARVALGREPLAEAAANAPMMLTGKGYVPLGQEAVAKQLPNSIARFNPYHDERGLFTTADGAGSGAGRPANSPTASDGKSSAKPLNGTDDSVLRAQGTEYRPSEDAPASVAPAADRQSAERRRFDPKSPGVPVVLPDGSKVPDANSPTGYMMAPVADLSQVAEAGRSAHQLYEDLIITTNTPTAMAAMVLELAVHVAHGGVFDYQREGNFVTGFTQLRQFQTVSNFNVGLFCQQAGLSLDETLTLAGAYARIYSRNWNPKVPYGIDPTKRPFIEMGYKAGQARLFDHSRQ